MNYQDQFQRNLLLLFAHA